MPGCPYFIANTFAHLLGGLLVTGISTENPLVDKIEKKPLTHLALVLFSFFLLFALLFTESGPFKYILFALFSASLGQTLTGFTKRLKQENLLSNTLIIVGTIFVCMTGIGLLDKGNMLDWEVYLSAALFGLIIAMVVTSMTTKTKKDADIVHLWISRLVVILFTLYIGFDVEVLKVNARLCKSNPDYVNESINVYLDILNLFTGVGGSLE
jgi:FtsH-binding integral membrane protein